MRVSDAQSMQTGFLHYLFGGYLAQFDVIVRELILELQACSQCILKTSMRRGNPSIALEDVGFARESALGRDPIFHATPHQYIPRQRTPVRARTTLPKAQELGLNLR